MKILTSVTRSLNWIKARHRTARQTPMGFTKSNLVDIILGLLDGSKSFLTILLILKEKRKLFPNISLIVPKWRTF